MHAGTLVISRVFSLSITGLLLIPYLKMRPYQLDGGSWTGVSADQEIALSAIWKKGAAALYFLNFLSVHQRKTSLSFINQQFLLSTICIIQAQTCFHATADKEESRHVSVDGNERVGRSIDLRQLVKTVQGQINHVIKKSNLSDKDGSCTK